VAPKMMRMRPGLGLQVARPTGREHDYRYCTCCLVLDLLIQGGNIFSDEDSDKDSDEDSADGAATEEEET
jgi:hypothetical protein